MRVTGLLRRWAHRHRDLADMALGVAVGVALLLVSLSQWGLTDIGLNRGVTLGLPFAVATVWVSRRRRLRDEGRERAMLEQRLQLARELHDAVAGQVAVVGIQAAAARRVLPTRPDEAAAALERIEIASRNAVDDLRRMLVTLREGPVAPSGAAPGLAQIDDLLSELRRAGLMVTTTRIGTSIAGLPNALDLAAYRIVQEALTNALKHGGTGTASLDLARSEDHLEIRVANPVSTRVTAATLTDRRRRGLGVTGILERASLFGGHAEAGPTRDGQWLVSVELPIGGGGRG